MAQAVASVPVAQLMTSPASMGAAPAVRRAVLLRPPTSLPKQAVLAARRARRCRSSSATAASQEQHINAAVATGVILHGFPRSSTSFMTRYALNVKGADYEQEAIKVVTLPNGKPDPEGEKPYLQANGQRLEKPGAIFNFINEKIPGPDLLPEDAAGRARCRTLATLSATEVAPFGYYRAIRLLEDELGVDAAGITKWRNYWLSHGFSEIEAILGSSPGTGRFLHGDSVSMADIFIMPQVHYSQQSKGDEGPFSLKEYPLLEKCYLNCLEDPAFVKALPENSK